MSKTTILMILLLACIFLSSCATTPITPMALRDYKPANHEEAAVISVIISFEESLNQADKQKLSGILADEAKMMHGRDKKTLTKKEYENVLSQRIKEMGIIKFSNPRVDINQDVATVKADYKSRVAILAYSFKLKKTGDKWFIIANSF